MKRNGQYWTLEDRAALQQSETFPDLTPIALRVLHRMPSPITLVCGPISSGGTGNLQRNLAIFDATIALLIGNGINVFDQMPFEEHFFRIIDSGKGQREGNNLLFQFYLPIFESGRIARVYMIHDWQSSNGAQWEHEQAKRLGIKTEHLPPMFI